MDRIVIKDAELSGAITSIAAIRTEFAGAAEVSGLAEAVGHHRLKEQIENFSNSWRIHRDRLQLALERVEGQLRGSLEAFGEWDDKWANAHQGGDAAAGGTPVVGGPATGSGSQSGQPVAQVPPVLPAEPAVVAPGSLPLTTAADVPAGPDVADPVDADPAVEEPAPTGDVAGSTQESADVTRLLDVIEDLLGTPAGAAAAAGAIAALLALLALASSDALPAESAGGVASTLGTAQTARLTALLKRLGVDIGDDAPTAPAEARDDIEPAPADDVLDPAEPSDKPDDQPAELDDDARPADDLPTDDAPVPDVPKSNEAAGEVPSVATPAAVPGGQAGGSDLGTAAEVPPLIEPVPDVAAELHKRGAVWSGIPDAAVPGADSDSGAAHPDEATTPSSPAAEHAAAAAPMAAMGGMSAMSAMGSSAKTSTTTSHQEAAMSTEERLAEVRRMLSSDDEKDGASP